jgi:hypothetical protein
MHRIKKPIKIVFISIGVLIILVIAFISPIAKYLIQKYDVRYTGREIEVDWAFVNPFTGYVHLSGLKIYEFESDSIFIKSKGLSADLSMRKLFSGIYEINSCKLNKPVIYVTQHERTFNFTDLIETFSSNDTLVEIVKEKVRFSLRNIKIVDAELHYDEDVTPVSYFIKHFNIESEGLRWDVDSLPLKYSFESGVGSGAMSGRFSMNLDSLDYRISVKVDDFDLDIINQYMKDLTDYGVFAATLNADVRSNGNFREIDSFSFQGIMELTDFHFGKDEEEDFASFEKLSISVKELNVHKLIYNYDSICLSKPFFKFELYDELDNIQTMFGKDGENVTKANADPNKFNLVIEIAKLVENVSKNFFRSHYEIGRFAIYDGDFQFRDYSLSDKFSFGLNPFNLLSDSIDKDHSRVEVTVKSGVKPYGNLQVALSINPQDSSYFDLNYHLNKISLAGFNPYFITHTSYPLDRGSLNFNGNWKVRDGEIMSDNHLILLDPRVSKRIKGKGNLFIPVPLAMAVVRERGNVIDYEIPIRGNLSNPKFRFRDVITDLLKNIFIKPVTTTYGREVRNTEREIEKSLKVKSEMRSYEINKVQERFLNHIATYLKKNPGTKIIVTPMIYSIKEKELILLFEAKKRYYLKKTGMSAEQFSEKDSMSVVSMSIQDKGFRDYLHDNVDDRILFTAQHKASILIPQSKVNVIYNNLDEARRKAFMEIFIKNGVEKQVVFNKSRTIVPFNGFSYFDVHYSDSIPIFIHEAYDKMNELDSEKPRKKYSEIRESIAKKK